MFLYMFREQPQDTFPAHASGDVRDKSIWIELIGTSNVSAAAAAGQQQQQLYEQYIREGLITSSRKSAK